MSATPTKAPERASFAEEALRLGGKSEDEVRRMGAMDKADEQVEEMFAKNHQTTASPVYKAVWEKDVPLDLFSPPGPAVSHSADAVMQRSLEVTRRRAESGTIRDSKNKISNETLQELASVGYWGLLISPEYGGSGAPFARFAPFLPGCDRRPDHRRPGVGPRLHRGRRPGAYLRLGGAEKRLLPRLCGEKLSASP